MILPVQINGAFHQAVLVSKSVGWNQWIDIGIIGDRAKEIWGQCIAWLSQPHILAVILTWAIVFTVIVTILLTLGFGPGGIVAGSLAAAFQSFMYGGFTPAGGIFATLTSMAMLGFRGPVFVLFASLFATLAATIVWYCGVGGLDNRNLSTGSGME